MPQERRTLERTDARTDALYLLMGTTCHCDGWKRARRPFCVACFRALTIDRQRSLHKEFGSGYEEAYAEAIRVLTGDGGEFADEGYKD